MEKKQNYENLPYGEVYANILEKVGNLSLLVATVTFVMYLSGVLEPLIPTSELPKYGVMALPEFLEASGAPTGWNWISFIGKGDYLNLIGIVMMALVTGLCYVVLLFKSIADGKKVFTIMLVIELLFILLAASNVLSGGH